MNLTKYFFEKFNDTNLPYYTRKLKCINLEKYRDYPCEYIDDEEIINTWKNRTYPSNNIDEEESLFEFLIISFYLYNEGYRILEQPDMLYKIDGGSELSDGILKNATRSKFGLDRKGAVSWASRRAYSDSLTFKKQFNSIPYSKNIDDLFKMVSSRNANFVEMSTDEKLEQIRNVFSNLGRMKNGKYVNLDIEKISNGFIAKQQLIDFQNNLQCFRHGEKDMIKQRNMYSDEQKQFMIDYGLMIINATERYIKTVEKSI